MVVKRSGPGGGLGALRDLGGGEKALPRIRMEMVRRKKPTPRLNMCCLNKYRVRHLFHYSGLCLNCPLLGSSSFGGWLALLLFLFHFLEGAQVLFQVTVADHQAGEINDGDQKKYRVPGIHIHGGVRG